MNKTQLIILPTLIGILGILLTCTLPGNWEDSSTYTITYDGNGNIDGTVPDDSNTYEEGATAPVFTNSGNLSRIPSAGTGEAYKFGGWNTQVDGNGMDYAEGTAFTMGDANVTLYAKWVAFEIQDIGPSGCLIFYDKGMYDSGWRYLEAAPADQGTSVWIEGNLTQTTLNGNTSTALGSGQLNSDFIINQFGHADSAAKVCLDYSYNTYADWFLPSLDELIEMYDSLHSQSPPLGGFADYNYWSSSENNNIGSQGVNFASGYSGAIGQKNDSNYVRPIRAF